MEIQDFQRLVEVFHLHGVRAEFAHLHELFFVAGQGRKFKILGQFLVEFLALLHVIAMDFAEAEEHGGEGVAACEKQQKREKQNCFYLICPHNAHKPKLQSQSLQYLGFHKPNDAFLLRDATTDQPCLQTKVLAYQYQFLDAHTTRLSDLLLF